MEEAMMTLHPVQGKQELEDLKVSGTEVMVRVPEAVDLFNLMSPSAVPGALAMGARQALADVGMLSTFWS
jgi:hypothetical protein